MPAFSLLFALEATAVHGKPVIWAPQCSRDGQVCHCAAVGVYYAGEGGWGGGCSLQGRELVGKG